MYRLEALAKAPLPTKFGAFQLHVFRWDDPEAHPGLSNEHLALVMGDVRGADNVAVRVHSECLTSEVFDSLKCDCRELLERAEVANKIRAYALQAMGADTVEANRLLHLPVDARHYDVAAAMIRSLGMNSVELMTNNPNKVAALRDLGIIVTERLPLLVEANRYSAAYLDVKRRQLQHEIPSEVTNAVPKVPEHEPDTEHVDVPRRVSGD
jgi:GTP cyclohydrolase II